LTTREPDRPVDESCTARHNEAEYPQLELKGTVTVIGDLIGPAVPEDHWESLRQPHAGTVRHGRI